MGTLINDLAPVDFEKHLTSICSELTCRVAASRPQNAKAFEHLVREQVQIEFPELEVDFYSSEQAFPDIVLGKYGIEVKLNSSDSWRSIANSVMETNRNEEVESIYVVFAKLGGIPAVDWRSYEDCVMHVRTSHVPRFELEIGARESLFSKLGITYNEFWRMDIHRKMDYIRSYARGRLKVGERLWWLEDDPQTEEPHTVPIQARLYTTLSIDEKIRYRGEAALLCPRIVGSGRARNKYDDVVLYLMTYRGVLCHQARDLFSAGSVGNPDRTLNGSNYIENSIRLLEPSMRIAANTLDDRLFVEYWGELVPPAERIQRWLQLADGYAVGWRPSERLFQS